MFTAVAHKKLDSTEGYFVEHLSQNDYYAAGQIRPGQWIGRGAEGLGLSLGQPVRREQFCALGGNRRRAPAERLTDRRSAQRQRRVFFDCTCSAPKRVSVVAVTLGGQRLVAGYEPSARFGFAELDTFAATRVG